MNSKGNKQAGALQTVLDNEIAAGLQRLGIRSPEQLYTEAELYPWVSENSEFYAILPAGAGARARAVELLAALAHDGNSSCVEWLDEYIAELREVLPLAAIKPLPALAAKAAKCLKEAVEGPAA
jgi:hypothetical protein